MIRMNVQVGEGKTNRRRVWRKQTMPSTNITHVLDLRLRSWTIIRVVWMFVGDGH